MESDTVYVVYKNSDLTEGRGPMIIDCIFSEKYIAENYIDPQPGIMGRISQKGWSKEKHGDWKIEPMHVFRSISARNAHTNQLIKENALKKLTDVEKKVLGL